MVDAGDAAGVGDAAGLEADLLAPEAPARDRRRPRPRSGARRTTPGSAARGPARRCPSATRSSDLGGHDPQQRRAPGWAGVEHHDVVGGPTGGVGVGLGPAQVPGVRDDAGARSQVEEGRPQPVVDVRQQEHRDPRWLAKDRSRTGRWRRTRSGRTTPASAARRSDRATRFDSISTPDGPRAEAGRRDDDAAVARPEVDDEVVRRHLRHPPASSRRVRRASAPRGRPCPPGRSRARPPAGRAPRVAAVPFPAATTERPPATGWSGRQFAGTRGAVDSPP